MTTTPPRPAATPRRGRRALAAAAAAALLAVLAAGCGGGSDSSSDGGAAGDMEAATDSSLATGKGAEAGAPEEAAGEDWAGESAGESAESTGEGANRSAVQTRAIIRNGELSLVTKSIAAARNRVDALLAQHGGFVASEQTSNDRSGAPDHSTLTLRVPEPAFDTVMKALAGIGKPEHTDRSAQDVTTEAIDVASRVASQEASLERVREFLREAKNLDDMIRLESELATRQAELESLKAQQRYLSDQTAMATITLSMRAPDASAPKPEKEESGFLAGLEDGWHALTAVLVGFATAFLAFGVLIPLLGYATWHAYEETIDASSWPPAEG
jgi:hypothetical protein